MVRIRRHEWLSSFGAFQVTGRVTLTWRGVTVAQKRIRITISPRTPPGFPPWTAWPWTLWSWTRAAPPRPPPTLTGICSRGLGERRASSAPTDPPSIEEASPTLMPRLKVNVDFVSWKVWIKVFSRVGESSQKSHCLADLQIPLYSPSHPVFCFHYCGSEPSSLKR